MREVYFKTAIAPYEKAYNSFVGISYALEANEKNIGFIKGKLKVLLENPHWTQEQREGLINVAAEEERMMRHKIPLTHTTK